MTKLWLVLLLLLAPARSSAQWLHGNEYVAGAGMNVALRGPWVARSWRRPIPRFLLAQTISLGYEGLVDCHSWNAPGHSPWRDMRGRLLGYVAAEVVLEVGRRVVR